MTVRAARWALLLLASVGGATAAAPPAEGPIVILSDEDGRDMNVGAQADIRERFEAAAYAGADIADEFKRLCLDTAFSPDALAAAGAKSAWGLTAGSIVLPAGGKLPAFEQPVLQSPSVRVSMWLGTDAGLAKRPILIRDRGAMVTSGYGTYKAPGRQCNFDAKLSSLASVDAFVARMNANLGVQPAKLVSKPSFADGSWLLTGAGGETRRVFFSAVGLNKPEQLLHIVVQSLPAKSH
jgi:hypothetical protein